MAAKFKMAISSQEAKFNIFVQHFNPSIVNTQKFA